MPNCPLHFALIISNSMPVLKTLNIPLSTHPKKKKSNQPKVNKNYKCAPKPIQPKNPYLNTNCSHKAKMVIFLLY